MRQTNWKSMRGEELFQIVSGYAPAQIIFSDCDADCFYIKVSDMNHPANYKHIVNSANRFSLESNSKIKLLPNNTVIIAKRGAAIFQNRVRILGNKSTLDTNLMGLVLNKELNLDYFYHQLIYIKIHRIVENAGIPQLNNKQLYPYLFDVPPLIEQRGIAEVLGTVDEAIKVQDQVIAKTELLKQGLMQQLLTEGIGHTEYKQTPIGRIPKKWEIKRIKDISRVKRGASPRPISDPKYWSETGRGWVRISDVTSTYKYLKKTVQYLSKLGESKSVNVNPGEVVLSICATIGRPIIIEIEACIHDGFVWFDGIYSHLESEFLFYYLSNKEREFRSKRQVGTQGNLNTSIVGNTLIVIPSFDEQKKIVALLRTQDQLLEQRISEKNTLSKLKQSLMQVLLSGERRVELMEDGLHRI